MKPWLHIHTDAEPIQYQLRCYYLHVQTQVHDVLVTHLIRIKKMHDTQFILLVLNGARSKQTFQERCQGTDRNMQTATARHATCRRKWKFGEQTCCTPTPDWERVPTNDDQTHTVKLLAVSRQMQFVGIDQRVHNASLWASNRRPTALNRANDDLSPCSFTSPSRSRSDVSSAFSLDPLIFLSWCTSEEAQ